MTSTIEASVLVPTLVLKAASQCFNRARQDFVAGARLLHEIKEKELWKTGYSSFGEYVEQECQISQSFAAKLTKVYEQYVLEGGVSESALQSVDAEKLYLALPLPGTTHEKLEKAKLLSRSDIKEELSEQKYGSHQHLFDDRRFGKCSVCKGYHLV
jgi:hypothetical protein